ncbi:uncharacterized protein LOC126672734 [Mercurialis annua]|uniref:uncharacterized protein LOC126672734 n=1 Tax=Mercurialis annua TaxID=3986 RepID=UPI00215FF3E3|nr:uncharacterized protein LOC126672734 [Mercurialis annua]
MKGKELMDSSLLWRIGDGCSIDIRRDLWIPMSHNRKLLGVINIPDWNRDRLTNSLQADDVEKILQIPISSRLPPDKLYWPLSKNGIYSVKSRYYEACKLLECTKPGSSSQVNTDSRIWTKVWSCSVPPKDRCHRSEESAMHALKDCDIVRGLWLTSPLGLRSKLSACSSMTDWVAAMFRSLKSEDAVIFVLSLWVIWNDRNNLVFDNPRVPPPFLFHCIPGFLGTM